MGILTVPKFVWDLLTKGVGIAGRKLAARSPIAIAVKLSWPLGRTIGWAVNEFERLGIPTATGIFPEPFKTVLETAPTPFGFFGPPGLAFWKGAAFESKEDMAEEWLIWWGEALVPGTDLNKFVLGDKEDAESIIGFALSRWLDEGHDADDVVAFARGVENYIDRLASLAGWTPELGIPPPKTFVRQLSAYGVGLVFGGLRWLFGDRAVVGDEPTLGEILEDVETGAQEFEEMTRGEPQATRRFLLRFSEELPHLFDLFKDKKPERRILDKLLRLVRQR